MISPALELDRIRLTYGQVMAIDDVSLVVGRNEFVTLLGPSGSGKTSTLRIVGGFEKPTSGEIRIAGDSVIGLPAYARDTATIFQSGALFPHKTVAQNIAFGLRMRKLPAAEIAARVREMLSIVSLSGFEDRYPAAMSGGQRQRVALARSLVVRPALLLFDEPMSALDLSLRLQLRAEIKRLHGELGFAAVFVTHDQGEAMSLSDRVAVMKSGRIVQIDRPEVVYRDPHDEFVYTFMGESCCIALRVAGGTILDSRNQALPLRLEHPLAEGDWRLYVRPNHIRSGSGTEGLRNRLQGHLKMVEFLGEAYRYHMEAGTVSIAFDSAARLECQPGDPLTVGWKSEDMRCFR
jgi:ABC-type Fe3+/spermidine/putrescine transport system ATPase subunit